MELSKEKLIEFKKRLSNAKINLLDKYSFYGLLLMHLKLGIDPNCETAYTDSKNIAFSPEFLDKLNNNELEFILMHEIMHVALKHCFRGENYNQYLFNVACDIVVNSNILKSHNMDLSSITVLGEESMHKAPNKQEGYLYTAEEVYMMLLKKANKGNTNIVDDHSKWTTKSKDTKDDEDALDEILINTYETCNRISPDDIPYGIERAVKKLKDGKLSWREILNEYLQFEITDYSFNPPDKRYQDVILPDFNDVDSKELEILFMVDTSGSISDKDLIDVYSEIYNALLQYGGKIKPSIAFFDAKIYPKTDFVNEEELLKIVPKGGGGTNFKIIFKYVEELDEQPNLLIILTDGKSEFPKNINLNIPVIWVISTKVNPPFGKIIHLNEE